MEAVLLSLAICKGMQVIAEEVLGKWFFVEEAHYAASQKRRGEEEALVFHLIWDAPYLSESVKNNMEP